MHEPLSQHLTVDEMLSDFKSKKNPILTYLARKRHKRGLRAYTTVGEKRLTVKTRIDDLKSIETDLEVPKSFGDSDKLVAEMIKSPLDPGHSLCCD